MKDKILIGFFLAILCFPVFQKITHIFPETKLHGVEWEKLRNPPTYQNIINESFQESFTKWFNPRIGFRPFLIKSYNQFFYSFFDTSPSTDVIFGKNKQLYLSDYIERYYSKQNSAYSHLTEEIKKIKKAQDLFKKRGVILLLVISPNKASIYPEYIPERFKAPGTQLNKNHENHVMLLDKYNVNYIDGTKIFMENKKTSKYPLFPRSGIHWNHLGTSIVLNELFDKFEFLSKKQLAKFYFNHINIDNNPEDEENDLALLLNIWTNLAYGPFPHPNFKTTANKNSFKPNTLIIGSSFTEQIAELLDHYDMTSNLNRFYYYSRNDTYSPRSSRPIGKLDWNEDVFKKDLIIEESNEGLIPGRYGFIDDALTMMTLDDLSNVTFAYKNEKYVESLLINGMLIYRLKKEASDPTVFLKSNKIKYNNKHYITVSFTAKDFVRMQCYIDHGKLVSAESVDISDGYKKHIYVFETTGRANQDYELSFSTDHTDVRDKDTFIKDIKMYSTIH